MLLFSPLEVAIYQFTLNGDVNSASVCSRKGFLANFPLALKMAAFQTT
jgi:hypothetical protein